MAQPASIIRQRGSVVGAKEERGSGKQDSHRVGAGQSVDARIGDAHEVIGRQGVELNRQLGAAQRRELVGVEVDPPAESFSIGQESAGLVEIEDTVLAEDIHRLCEPAAGDARVNLLDHLGNPPLGIVAVLEGHLVGGETGGVEIHHVTALGRGDDLEDLDLGGQIEAIA